MRGMGLEDKTFTAEIAALSKLIALLPPQAKALLPLFQADIGEKSKGGAKNSVTEGDMRSHKVMFYGFRKTFPGD